MSWIKRNLYFLIGSVVALALMGLAGWYLYSKWQLNNEIMTKLDELYGELDNLNKQNPHPGDGRKVDNIEAAKQQRQQLREFAQKTQPHFQRIVPIPDLAKVTDRELSAALSRTIDQMQRDAAAASVSLPPKYSFSFEAQKQGMTFAPGSLVPLSIQLGEVKTICDILFQAKVNGLDSLRRERISPDDAKGPQTDYLEQKSVTNELAVLTPYEVTFRCFSSELALVLSGLASSPHGLIVKSINVEPAALQTPVETGGPLTYNPVPMAAPAVPVAAPAAPPPMAAEGMSERYMSRYGMPGAGGRGPGVGVPLRGPTVPGYTPPAASVGTTLLTAQPVNRGGLPTVLDEKQLKVTLTLEIVKLLPSK